MTHTFVCTSCGKRIDTQTHAPHCECGGLFELDFIPPAWDPTRIDRTAWNIFRYRDFMAVDGDTWRGVTMGEGMTPIINLDEQSGCLLKMDYCMPTLSFKDRGAATLVAHMKAIGVTHCVQDSSGNAGNSVAAYAARAGISCEIYVPEGTSPKKITMIEAHGAKVHVVSGSRDHCADVCRQQVAERGAYYANHVYNPYFYEGMKAYIYETCRQQVAERGAYYANHVYNPYFYEGMKAYIYETFEQLGRIPANIVIPVGNGTLFIGAVKALEHLVASGAIERFPNIIALQSEKCDPLYQARRQGLDHPATVTPTPTMAEGIAIGVPMRGTEILNMMRKHDIKVVTCPEDKILEARATLARRGIYCEHTTAANYAAWLHYCELYGPTPDTLITMCGAGIKSDH